ncbi:MAG TPA: glycosyltransferase family 4 protein [Polyangiaceae bacterium]|nr:glycosyltransferase family 4 protein [Polyangiaceae bacterium]
MTDKIGVLFIHSSEEFGADAAVHADLMRYLDRNGFEVHVACTVGSTAEEPLPMRIMRGIPELRVRPTHFVPHLDTESLPLLLGSVAAFLPVPQDLLDLRRYVKANRIRIIHSTDRPRNAVYSVMLGKLTGAKSVVHVHVKWSEGYGRAAHWAVRNADAVFSISRYVTSTLVEMGRAERDVHTVLNAIDTSRWNPAADGASLRQELGVTQDAPLLASVSRLFAWKGQRELLRAFARAHAGLPNLKLMIVGSDASGFNHDYSRELKELALQLGVADHVIFTGGRSDIERVMAACDIFSMPSFEEPFGLVFLEAMVMAKPVVALNNGGTPEVVEHGRSGLLSPPWDIPGLAANISTLVRDRELRLRLGRYGRERAVQLFDASRMARDAERAYAAVLGSGP